MKRYDCSKVLDFKHEKDRMCEMIDDCDNCCLGHVQRIGEESGVLWCDCFSDITEDEIAALQKWSDEHPEKTRAEAFLERIPSCSLIKGRPSECWGFLTGSYHCVYKKGNSCTDCWDEPYKGEFEKEKKDES